MAKIHLDRLKKRYGWTGGKYRALMERIIAANHESIANAVGRVKVGRIRAQAKKLGAPWKTMLLPDLTDVLPKRSVFIRKGAERGKLLSDKLRTRLAVDLRTLMQEFTTATGLPTYIRRPGEPAKGQINEKLVKAFRQRIVQTFEDYTKIDPEIGVPRNVETIAITEVRSAINDVKHSYFTRLAEKNPGVVVKKRWRHHPELSRTEPRPGHADMDGVEVAVDEPFHVPEYVKMGGDWQPTGGDILMDHPHDPNAGPEDVIACHCDVDYVARQKTAGEKQAEELKPI